MTRQYKTFLATSQLVSGQIRVVIPRYEEGDQALGRGGRQDCTWDVATGRHTVIPEMAVKESTQRVEGAMVNFGFERAMSRIVINPAPACSRQ